MDKALLADLEQLSKALKAAIVRSQSGLAALRSIAKLGAPSLAANAPNIFAELRQLEGEAQRLLKTYRDQLNKASISVSTAAVEETHQ